MRRVAAATLLAGLLLPLLAGCLRVEVSMGVSSADRVSGQIIAATPPKKDGDKGPQLQAPESLGSRIRVEPYNEDGYVGSQAYFEDLSFGEVENLAELSDQSDGMFKLHFERSGDLVSLDGKVDLKKLPSDSSDVRFTIAFPTRVATTNGTREGDSIVTWKFPPGEISTIRANVRYSDPNTRSFAGWAGIVAGGTLGIALVVAALAYVNRNPWRRPELVKPLPQWMQRLRLPLK